MEYYLLDNNSYDNMHYYTNTEKSLEREKTQFAEFLNENPSLKTSETRLIILQGQNEEELRMVREKIDKFLEDAFSLHNTHHGGDRAKQQTEVLDFLEKLDSLLDIQPLQIFVSRVDDAVSMIESKRQYWNHSSVIHRATKLVLEFAKRIKQYWRDGSHTFDKDADELISCWQRFNESCSLFREKNRYLEYLQPTHGTDSLDMRIVRTLLDLESIKPRLILLMIEISDQKRRVVEYTETVSGLCDYALQGLSEDEVASLPVRMKNQINAIRELSKQMKECVKKLHEQIHQ